MKCIEKEKKALLVLKDGVLGAHRHYGLHSWKKEEEDCCLWKGVGCDNHTCHVTRLHLSSLIAPSYVNTTSVGISRSLLDLPYLSYLDLSRNFLGGTTIPRSIGSLTNLVHLDLSVSHIWGSISDHIGNLSNLQYLNLSFNDVDGPIPKFIGSLHNLRYLDLSQSYFSGAIPHELGNLTKLEHLDLANSDLSGGENFKWLYNLSSLTHLDLSGISFAAPSTWADILCSFALVEFEEISVVTNAKVQYLFMDGHVLSNAKPVSHELYKEIKELCLSLRKNSEYLINKFMWRPLENFRPQLHFWIHECKAIGEF
ncbi:hypothetical protein DCAR_0728913 [Daucus carota subsp. sativus]|uniref:Leucine-rich repeat-containing N-terminal plant-type domain-containing protein n=1 Tax=Daucus carota subsp. sativus TaxID=79200 RepID=A0AAF1BAN5_DAUCS|nr:PREDICTED: probable leucine-rich repeat receptor-like protein kinase At1g35710 [Daucus carota subsp. sativus]WOH09456.1 hypothetical protein DCAR_0728913 [Daucus carota subsp. sativus]